jgi:N-acetylmuramic acid 6-phosphate etherase
MRTRSKWQHLATEATNPLSRDLDTRSVVDIIDVMARDHRRVLTAIQQEKGRIARAAGLMADSVRAGGRLIFVGAGTSGRLGVLEAAELPPTFGIAPEMAQAIMAGGPDAVHRSKEGAEDDNRAGTRAMRACRPRGRDVVIAISASGVTPFVHAAVSRARAAGARVVGITSDAGSPLKRVADVTVVLSVGPEVVAGSTRLKAGTATKIVLNMLTTAAMVRAGKTYGHLMVDVKSTSEKLRDRARRIVGAIVGLDDDAADSLLQRAGWDVKAAILMHQSGITPAAARSRLRVEPRLRKHLRGR